MRVSTHVYVCVRLRIRAEGLVRYSLYNTQRLRCWSHGLLLISESYSYVSLHLFANDAFKSESDHSNVTVI